MPGTSKLTNIEGELRDSYARVHLEDQQLIKAIHGTSEEDSKLLTDSIDERMLTGSAQKTNRSNPIDQSVFMAIQSRQELSRSKQTEEKLSAQFATHSFATVTRDDAYPFQQIEEEFIKFMCEKVVMMREIPFMKATQELENNMNMKKIYERAAACQKQGKLFASKDFNRRGEPFDPNNITMTRPYDGAERIQQAGKATFKLKLDTILSKDQDSIEKGTPSEMKKSENRSSMLTNEQLKDTCDKYNLSRGQVY